MDVAKVCRYKETRDIVVSALEPEFKITNNLDRRRVPSHHQVQVQSRYSRNNPQDTDSPTHHSSSPTTSRCSSPTAPPSLQAPTRAPFINSRENLPQRPLRSLALLLMGSIDLRLQELYVRRVRLSLLRLEVRSLSLHQRRVRVRRRLKNPVVVVVRVGCSIQDSSGQTLWTAEAPACLPE